MSCASSEVAGAKPLNTMVPWTYDRKYSFSCSVCSNLKIWGHEPRSLNINDVRKASARGCKPCALLESVVGQIWKNRRQDYSSVQFELSRHSRGLFLSVKFPEPNNDRDEVFEISTSIERPCHNGAIRLRRSPFGIMSLTAATSQISQWLTACLIARHGDMKSEKNFCRHADTSPQPLPTRVIFIKGPQDVCLYSTNPQKLELAHYACLSHCWGREKFAHTESFNKHDYEENIPWGILPLTFQDAVEVTWRLGIRYLWIDSLCIIQDDKDDWRHESSKMASIYSQAYVTLAATAATGPSDGLMLRQSDRQGHESVRPQRISQAECDIYIVSVPPKVLQRPDDWPLLARAWVFQERYLSPRTVHFTSNELIWECKSLGSCECSLNGYDITGNPKLLHSPTFPLTRDRSNSPRDRDFATMGNWHRIVFEYSALKLTYRDDIFPALQGIAKLMQEKRQTRYFAGLWEDTFLYDMLWRGTSKEGKVDTSHAPSWSWASEVGTVRFLLPDLGHSAAASVISIVTTPSGNDPLGAISSGTLQLQGRCIEMDVTTQVSTLKNHYGIPVMVMELFYSVGSSLFIVLKAVDHSRYKRIDLEGLQNVSAGSIYTDIHVLLEREGAVRTLTVV